MLTLAPLACSGAMATGAGGASEDASAEVESDNVEKTDARDAEVAEAGSEVDTNPLREECRAAAYDPPAFYCGGCMEASCAPACEACYAVTDCVGWIECAEKCPTGACLEVCTTQFPGGEAPALAWFGSSGCAAKAGCDCTLKPVTQICDSDATTGETSCDACLGANCCDVVKTCQADAACNDCLMNGTADLCGGNAAYETLDECRASSCGTLCHAPQGCGLSTSGTVPTCDACIEANCCAEDVGCTYGMDVDHNGSSDCLDVLTCRQNCAVDDSACRDACDAAQPEGAALLNELFGCLSQACGGVCPFS